ncbi:hypothetical protein BU25DRAFT_113949 [Macroventuria anomochaeta]|uniref:Uncharacterized protein n=1 Tax=Macroventuria anomochaeta TaxID=301207 RepID=A0ACB6RVP0_9PLEO|nr:uncharacterized protein BU25DRAFT_113949 [Macroventuria anomochaeta]KAF2625480.1 hypothetical protein BU25DRAFT_113949 [Macroventuria anomochaeta]
MDRCPLCNDQEKKDESDARLVFDFTPDELLLSASKEHRKSCLVILKGFRQVEDSYLKHFHEEVKTVVAYCHKICEDDLPWTQQLYYQVRYQNSGPEPSGTSGGCSHRRHCFCRRGSPGVHIQRLGRMPTWMSFNADYPLSVDR